MSRWLRAGVSLVVVATSCKGRESAQPAAPLTAPTAASAAAPAPPPAPPAPGGDGSGPKPAPRVTGAPRTKEYSWMSVASWHEKHEALVARAKKGRIDLLFLGDSITEGWLDNAVWQRHYARRSAANFGIGGDTVENLLWRVDHGEVEGLAPKVAVVLIGTNNLGLAGDAPDAVAHEIEAFVAALRARLPGAKVLLLALFPRGGRPDDPMRAKVAEVNARIARLDDGGAVRFLDLGPRLTNKDGVLSREVAPDLLHLSEKGYAIWAEGMEPLLAAMLGAR